MVTKKFLIIQIRDHFKALYGQLDPIVRLKIELPNSQIDLERINNKNRNNVFHFVFAFVFLVFGSFYGTIVHEYVLEGMLKWKKMIRSSPNLFTHQCAPQIIWLQMDFGIALDTGAAMAILLVLIFSAKVRDKFSMFISKDRPDTLFIGSKVLESSLSSAILRKRSQLKPILKTFFVLINLTPYVYELYFWLNVKKSVVTVLFWLFIFPMYFFYFMYGVFAPQLYIISASRYICVWQKHLVDQLVQVNSQMRTKPRKTEKVKLLITYLQLNRKLLCMCATIEEYTRYSAPFLSIVIPFFVVIQTFMMAVVVFVQTLSPLYKDLFSLASIGINFVLFFIIYQCATVMAGNTALENQNRTFYYNYFIKLRLSTNIRHMVKGEALWAHGRFQWYSFYLLDNHRINTNTYNLIISYITIVFMFLYKNQYNTN